MTDDMKLEDQQPRDESPAAAEKAEHMIPQSRFNQINDRYKASDARVAELELQIQSNKDAELAANQKWQELAENRQKTIDDLTTKAGRTDELEQALQDAVKARIEAVPEHMRTLIPTHGTAQDMLAWLNLNHAQLIKPVAPNLDGGKGGLVAGDNGLPKLTRDEKVAADGFGITYEEYAKLKQERAKQGEPPTPGMME